MNLNALGDDNYPTRIGRIILQRIMKIFRPTRSNEESTTTSQDHFIDNYPENNLELKFSFNQMSVILSAMIAPKCSINIYKI